MKVLSIAVLCVILGRASTLVRPFGGVAPAITIEGDFGSVRIIGDDAEAFLDAVLPRTVQFEDTTTGCETHQRLISSTEREAKIPQNNS